MTIEQARQYLKVEKGASSEELWEQYMLLIFEVRNYLLRNTVLLPLMRARVGKVLRYGEALELLWPQGENIPWRSDEVGDKISSETGAIERLTIESAQHVLELGPGASVLDMLRAYEQKLMDQKLALSQQNHPERLASVMTQLAQVQQAYEVLWENLTKDIKIAEEVEVKALEQLDSGQMIVMIVDAGLAESGILSADEWSGKFTAVDHTPKKSLMREIVRVRKVGLLGQAR